MKVYWHALHKEYLVFCVDYDKRVHVIIQTKPKHEQADRIKWFQLVKGELPQELISAMQANTVAINDEDAAWKKLHKLMGKPGYEKADAAYIKAQAVWKKKSNVLRKLYKKHRAAIEKLHTQECPDCTWNGKKLVFKKDD